MRTCLISGDIGSSKTFFFVDVAEWIQRIKIEIGDLIKYIKIKLESILHRLEDEIQIKRIEFFVDIQKNYGDYKQCKIEMNVGQVHRYKELREQFERRTSQQFEFNELQNPVQKYRNNFATIIKFQCYKILDKILRTKGRVRQKPLYFKDLELLIKLKHLKNPYLFLQRFLEIHKQKRTSRERTKICETSICQCIEVGKGIGMLNGPHLKEMICSQ